jgi:dienelactone hydrolase
VVDVLQDWRARSVLRAPLAESLQRFPIITLSHGLGTPRFVFTARAEELASHGYVVVGIEHPYGAAVTRFPDGRVVAFSGSLQSLDRIRLQAADVRFVLDSLEHLQRADPIGLFTGRLDLGRIGMLGHSFGGATAALACVQDPRCTAGAVYDFELLDETYAAGAHKPLLVINSERFASSNGRFLERWTADGYRLVIAGTVHNDFMDVPLWPYTGSRAGGNIDPVRGFAVINAYTLAFFDAYLQGQRSQLLDGPAPEYSEVRIETRRR